MSRPPYDPSRLLPRTNFAGSAAMLLQFLALALAFQVAAPGGARDHGLVYALDDVYIHMALAKNLVLHGVWGLTPWEITNASSSPLWVLLMAGGFALLGVDSIVPIALTLLSFLAAMLAIDHAANQAVQSNGGAAWNLRAIALSLAMSLAVIACASMPALILQGMEHPLHAALTLLAALSLSRAIAEPASSSSLLPRPVLLAGYALLLAALTLLRYESLWLIVLGAALLAWRRRYGLAALTLASGVLPIVAFGLWAMAHDQSFLPAAILTKSIGPAMLSGEDWRRLVARFTWHPLQRIWSVKLLSVLWLAACAVLAIRLLQLRLGLLQRRWLVLLGLFAAGTWIHATFATFGWGSRYEAYLIVLGIVAIGCWLAQAEERRALTAAFATPPWRIAGGAVAALLLAAFLYTGVVRLLVTGRNAIVATEEVRDRDLFIARFLAEAYPQQSVMAMNVGAIAWIGEPHLTDVLALGDPQTLRLFLRGQLDPAELDRLAAARQVKVAVIFKDWFLDWTGGRPPWIAVAEVDPKAQRPLNYTLYARTDADARELADKLRAYRAEPQFHSQIIFLPPYR